MKTFVLIVIFLGLQFCLSDNMAAHAADAKTGNVATEKKHTDLSCQYYTVKMPEKWKVVKGPEEKNGNISAIFTARDGSSTVSIVMGPALGSDAKTIAAMFAEQFKAPNAPTEKNNSYTFSFKRNNIMNYATTTVDDNIFKLVTVSGNQKNAQKFIADSIIPAEEIKEAEADTEKPDTPSTKDVPEDSKASAKNNDSAPAPQPAETGTAKKTAEENKGKDEKAGNDASAQKKSQDDKTADKKDGDPAASSKTASDNPKSAKEVKKSEKDSGNAEKKEEFFTDFYKVILPQGWKAIMPPKEDGGNLNAIFATDSGETIVTFIIGPNLGADAKTIASMFAEQFKATSSPSLRNGQYTFGFPYNNGTAQGIVAVSGPHFMLTTISGDKQVADKFISKSVQSEKFADLLPK